MVLFGFNFLPSLLRIQYSDPMKSLDGIFETGNKLYNFIFFSLAQSLLHCSSAGSQGQYECTCIPLTTI